MNALSQLKEAFFNLFASKMRSMLAVLGILIGTASVVAMVSSGQFATQRALQEFKQLGTDLLSVSMFSEQASDREQAANNLDLDTIERMQAISPAITKVAPYISVYAPISLQGVELQGNIIGATQSLQDVIKISVTNGRFISFLDKYSYFAVMGNGLAHILENKGITDLIGKQIKLGDNFFTIIGIADDWSENAFFNGDINNSVMVPLQAAKVLNKDATIGNIVFQLNLKTSEDTQSLQDQLTQYIHDRVAGQKLFFRSSKELIKSMEKQQHIFTLLLGLIGSISLIVGGIGVMNIMLVSVLERRREIGIRMAVGATRNNIRFLFLIEAISVSLVGGILGVLLGIFVSYVVSHFAGWAFSLLLTPPMIGFFVSMAVGVFFGFYPAYQASQLDPIQTLRSD